jgi:hypothetical protein
MEIAPAAQTATDATARLKKADADVLPLLLFEVFSPLEFLEGVASCEVAEISKDGFVEVSRDIATFVVDANDFDVTIFGHLILHRRRSIRHVSNGPSDRGARLETASHPGQLLEI